MKTRFAAVLLVALGACGGLGNKGNEAGAAKASGLLEKLDYAGIYQLSSVSEASDQPGPGYIMAIRKGDGKNTPLDLENLCSTNQKFARFANQKPLSGQSRIIHDDKKGKLGVSAPFLELKGIKPERVKKVTEELSNVKAISIARNELEKVRFEVAKDCGVQVMQSLPKDTQIVQITRVIKGNSTQKVEYTKGLSGDLSPELGGRDLLALPSYSNKQVETFTQSGAGIVFGVDFIGLDLADFLPGGDYLPEVGGGE